MLYIKPHTDLTDLTDFSCIGAELRSHRYFCAGADLMSHRSHRSHRLFCAWKDACVRKSVKISQIIMISDFKKSVRSVRSV